MAALNVIDEVARTNLSTLHPREGALASGASLRPSYVLCAKISNACDGFGQHSRLRSSNLSIGLINGKFSNMILTCLFLSFAADGAFVVADAIRRIKWICVPCRHPRLLGHIVILDVIISFGTLLGATVGLANCGTLNIVTFGIITHSKLLFNQG